MDSEAASPSPTSDTETSSVGGSPVPPRLFRQTTITGFGSPADARAGANGSASFLGSVAQRALGALAPGFARSPSSANSAYAFPTPLPHGSSPGATGRGLHAPQQPVAVGVLPLLRLPVGVSPPVIQPPAKSRAAVMEEAFDAALWF